MTEIEFLHEMVKAAGGDVNKLKDKLKSTYYECLIDCMKNGGGGGGLPSGGEPHQMLVTDADGNTVWEDRTHYHDVTNASFTCVSASGLEVDDEGTIGIFDPFAVDVEGEKTYTVTYNGADYECTAKTMTDSGISVQLLGNIEAMMGTGDNGMPFLAMCVPSESISQTGFACMIMVLDGATTVDITIAFDGTIEELKKIPKKYLPEEKFGVTEEETVFLPETTVSQNDGLGLNTTAFEKIPEIGQGFIATFDGVDYECIALESTNEDYAVVFGNSSSIGGDNNKKIPFGIGIFSESSSTYEQGYRFIFSTTDSNEHTLMVHMPVGYVQRINSKYMPKSLSPVWNIVSNIYEASVNGEDIPDTEVYYSALTSAEIVDLIKTGRLGGMQLFYGNVTDETSGATEKLICPITDIKVAISSTGAMQVEAHATINSSTVAFIVWYASTNNYTVQIQSTTT